MIIFARRLLERFPFDHRVFFVVYILLGLPYLVLTGPFRVPDERNHFLRSYEISELRLVPFRVAGGYPGDNLPASLSRLSETLGIHADHLIQPEQLAQARSLALVPEQREFVEFSTSAVYSPLAYIPAAAAIALGRTFGAGPLALVYFARAANLLVVAWLIALSLSRAGYARPAVLVVALFPTTLFQVASVSGDAMTYGVCFLWLALVMETIVGKDAGISRRKFFLLVGVGLALSQIRPPFPLLSLLILLMPVERFGLRRVAGVSSAVLAASLLPAAAWNAAAAGLFLNPLPELNIDPAAQFTWVRIHPGPFLHRVKHDLMRNGVEYWEQLVGRLGWLNIRLPLWIPAGFAALFVGCALRARGDQPTPKWWQRSALAVMFAAGVVGIQLSLYLCFNPVRSDFILGVQGRYFVPFAAVAAFALSSSVIKRALIDRFIKIGGALFVISAHLCTWFVLARVAGKI